MRAMVRDGQLLRNRADEYCLTRHLDVVTGTVLAHRDGFGFLRPDDGSPDLYLEPRQMQLLWDGDRVAVRANETSRGREGHEGPPVYVVLLDLKDRSDPKGIEVLSGTFPRRRSKNSWICDINSMAR